MKGSDRNESFPKTTRSLLHGSMTNSSLPQNLKLVRTKEMKNKGPESR